MKIIVWIVALAAFFALQATAQGKEFQRLQTELNNHPQEDTFRINRLVELCASGSLSITDLESRANELLSLSRKTGNAIGEGYGYVYLAAAKTNKEGGPEVMLLFNKADSIAKKSGDRELLTSMLLKKASFQNNTDTKAALATFLQAEEIAQGTRNRKLLSRVEHYISGLYLNSLADYPKSMEYALKAINSGTEAHCGECLSLAWLNMALLYTRIGDESKALSFFQKAYDMNSQLGDKNLELSLLRNIGESYRLMGRYPEAIRTYKQALQGQDDPFFIELGESNLADVYVRTDSLPLAFEYGFRSLAGAKKIDDMEGIAWIDGILSRAYLKNKMLDSALYYANDGLAVAKKTGSLEYMRDNAQALAEAYGKASDFKKAFDYHKQYISYRDSMLNGEVTKKTALLEYSSDLEKKQAQITVLNQQKKLQQNFLISVCVALGLIIIATFLLVRNNRQKRIALAELKQTQAQLIQSEKMASLGELTAGIAHEIQNPLNFVNNFSEVNNELIEEIKRERLNGRSETEEEELLNDLYGNNEKIILHGKRADAIVKGMLQHSRKSSGEKEATDINVLADEYLRLSYHGIRAKDKNFNAIMKTDFDNGIGKINVIPQDIGRVLLNLYNNGFYAVSVKASNSAGASTDKTAENNYKPTVSVTTRKVGDKISINVKDNGPGIPQDIVDKIFQPFFTTKPTGEGTGLGLSLSYDIIKAHGGGIKVDTKQNEYTIFTVLLPL